MLSGGTGPHVQDLLRAGRDLQHEIEAVDFRTITSNSLKAYDAVIVRTMPAGSLEQIVFRMDHLHERHAAGQVILNPPRALEACVNKSLTTARLQRAGIATPRTLVVQNAEQALAAFEELGGDVVLKPLFGAEGRGLLRITERELAWRTFRAVEQIGGILYLQEYVRNPGWDLRVFVLGGRVLGAMKRTANDDWRTNVAQGGRAESHDITTMQADLAILAAQAVGAVVAGVDLLPLPNGNFTCIEVNGVPGWAAFAAVTGVDVAVELMQFTSSEAGR